MADVVLASEVPSGSYICLKTGSLFGAVIRLVTRSQFDHVVLVTGPGTCTQATLRGVKTGPLSQFHGALAVANSAELMTAEQRTAAVAYALAVAMQQEEYAFSLLPVIALRLAGVRWGWLLRAGQRGDGDPAVICSELISTAGQRAGLDWLCGEATPAVVTPGELAARKPCVPVAWD